MSENELILTVVKYVGGVPEVATIYKILPKESTYYTVSSQEVVGINRLPNSSRVKFVITESSSPELLGTSFDAEEDFLNFLADLAQVHNPTKRPSWEEYFFNLTKIVADRSTCLRRKVGAIAIDPHSKRILATGYNGAPRGTRHCLEIGCLRQKLRVPSGQREELCRAVHAEANLVAQAAMHGISLAGSVVYCTTKPCISCLKLLINVGVQKIYYQNDYPVDDLYLDMVNEANIVLKRKEEK